MKLHRILTSLATISAAVWIAAGPVRAVVAGFDGSSYVQIAPTFNGSDGNTSYIRLSNDGTASTTVTIKAVGATSGTVYGSGTIQVAAAASPQYSLSQILTAANAGALANGDAAYSIYLQDSDATAFYQHVIFNGGNSFFENMTTCKYQTSGNYTGLNQRLDNVHTSRLAAFPANISIHNFAAAAVTYNAQIYDATNGTLIGTVPVQVGANATVTQPETWFEQMLKWSPSSSQVHINIVFLPAGGATYQAEVNDYIYNQQFQAYVNVSQRCPIAAAAVASAPTTSCPTASYLTVSQNSHNTAYAAPTLSVSCSSTQVTVTSNSIPTFEYVQTTPNALKSYTKTYKMPLTPTVATGTNTTAPLVGAEAVSVAGLPLYGPTEAPSDGSKDPVKDQLLDTCGGHTDFVGLYHHHYRPDCLFSTTVNKTGLVIGYAFDGYPILAPYECTDTTCKTVYKVHSSYTYIGGSTAAWSSNAYVAGKGNLDKCNGMTRPDGTYAYYATDEFPYFLACYHGTPDTSNFNPGTTFATIVTQ